MTTKKTTKKPAPPQNPVASTSRKTRSKMSAPMILREPPRQLCEPTAQEIAERAYALFEEQGRAHGHELEHWLLAEQELRLARR